ncbi:hypothetical protein N185_28790 [Sinorhizobium sp. GW3]|nr:hypothetical protein N185_28790 [Sinorhizobium sp. GW3]
MELGPLVGSLSVDIWPTATGITISSNQGF